MSETIRNTDLCGQLHNLLRAGTLEDEPQKLGERMMNRLMSEIRVVLLGPAVAGKDYLLEVLTVKALPQTSISVADQTSGFHFEDAEVCIWCTSGFGAEEADQWRDAPDRLKDHSFLVPIATFETTAERHGQAQLDVFEGIAAEEFHGLFPIVIGPQDANEEKNAVQKLIREVGNLVQSGLAADSDNAQLFLKMHHSKIPERSIQPADQPRAPVPQSVGLGTTNEHSATLDVYRKAYATLRDNATRLAPFTSANAESEYLQILEICEEASSEIADVVSESRLDNPEFGKIKDDIQSAADKILLMSLEGGMVPAITATTIILQIQRELEVQIAS